MDPTQVVVKNKKIKVEDGKIIDIKIKQRIFNSLEKIKFTKVNAIILHQIVKKKYF